MRKHWLDKWECDVNRKIELTFYQQELDKYLDLLFDLNKRIKTVEYKIDKLREKIFELSD